jgi:dTDP-L-rhamnose 4-epimerase
MILVTGGAGFIGSHVVEELLAGGHAVRVLDNLSAGRADHVSEAAELIEGSLCDAELVRRCLEGVEAVGHLAGMVGLGGDFADVVGYAHNNDLGTAVLLREIAQHADVGRLVLASSMVVYGEGRYNCWRHGVIEPPPRPLLELTAGRFEPACPVCGAPLAAAAVPESAPSNPRNVYAATKLHQEHLCLALARETGISVAALRYHNVYGPRMPRDTPYAGVAAIFASALAAGKAPRVFEDGRQLRDFVHVRDVARATATALTLANPVAGALNIASGQPRSVGEMAESLADAVGGPRPVVTGEFRLGDVRHVFASADRAAGELGFRAIEDFQAGMADLAQAELASG